MMVADEGGAEQGEERQEGQDGRQQASYEELSAMIRLSRWLFGWRFEGDIWGSLFIWERGVLAGHDGGYVIGIGLVTGQVVKTRLRNDKNKCGMGVQTVETPVWSE